MEGRLLSAAWTLLPNTGAGDELPDLEAGDLAGDELPDLEAGDLAGDSPGSGYPLNRLECC
jgi:hypothetical protein